jgi:hypothetical protein
MQVKNDLGTSADLTVRCSERRHRVTVAIAVLGGRCRRTWVVVHKFRGLFSELSFLEIYGYKVSGG